MEHKKLQEELEQVHAEAETIGNIIEFNIAEDIKYVLGLLGITNIETVTLRSVLQEAKDNVGYYLILTGGILFVSEAVIFLIAKLMGVLR